jgi:ribosome-binding protein aMBF1 (putative translation factor)
MIKTRARKEQDVEELEQDSKERIRHIMKNLRRIEEKLADTPDVRGLYLPSLRAARVAAMISQRELAELAGTHQSTIHALEHQDRAASPSVLRRLCQALGVGPGDLCSTHPYIDGDNHA